MPEKAAQKSLKIFYYSIEGVGHLNASLGMAQALAKRGHQIYFLLQDTFAGRFAAKGFQEILLTKNETPEAEKVNPIKEMADTMRKSGFLDARTPLERVNDQNEQPNFMMIQCYEGSLAYNPQIERAIAQHRPDVIIVDNFLVPPAILKSSIPWVFQCSFAPLAILRSDLLPPFSSGYPSNDSTNWQEYREAGTKNVRKHFVHYQEELNKAFDYYPEKSIRNNENLVPQSPYLNFYGYPLELDYQDVVELPKNFATLDAFIRDDSETALLEPLNDFISESKNTKLIYVSLGTIASINVELMKRIVGILGKTQYRYIVSKGPLADEYELPANCWGAANVPQTQLLPLVDLVITHGGNNTVTETFYFGKPMIVMPFFADQLDNAQRVHEKQFGKRMEPFTFTEEQLIGTIDQLLNDEELACRLEKAAKRIQASNSKEQVCQRIEQVAQAFKTNLQLDAL